MSGVTLIPPLVVILALGWVAAIVATPMLPAAPAALLYLVGSRICHQIAERSFHLADAQLPVCARCLGLYAGFAVGVLFAPSSVRRVRTILAIGALPTLVTLLAEWSGLWQTSNVVRAVAGAPLGLAVAFVVVAACAGLHYDECASRPPIAPNRPPSHI
jgi:uncharacterized membrane protein